MDEEFGPSGRTAKASGCLGGGRRARPALPAKRRCRPAPTFACYAATSLGRRKERVLPSGPDAPKKSKASVGGAFAGGIPLLKGVAFSAIGAVLGAVVWALVAVVTQLEIGWIAWAIGAAAGGGMAAGVDDKSDGTVPGIIAAFMSLGGIVLGKILIVVWVLFPLLAGNPDDFAYKREVLAGIMANEALEKRGIDPDTATDAQIEHEVDLATQSLEGVSDEEIDQRFADAVEAIQLRAQAVAARATESGATGTASPKRRYRSAAGRFSGRDRYRRTSGG